MLAQSLVLFAQNIYLLIGLLFVLGVLGLLIFCVWTGAKVGLFHARQRHAEQAAAAAKIGPDGRPYPPSGEGICTSCQRAFNRVFHMPDGARLCRDCYYQACAAAPGVVDKERS